MTRIFKTTAAGIFLLLACFFSNPLFAQDKEVRGRVISSEDNKPVPGITVTVKGTTRATATDAQGNFRIMAADNAVLVFSSVGFVPYEAGVRGKNEVNVTMTVEVKQGEDVVVIGYQSIKRKDLLASVSSIGAKDLKDIPINSAAEALNGRLAGVTATTAEGSPDADIRIRIRGGISITQDNSPLYVIDGVQMENALSVLSPQDIQSIDVLKDAAATSIYGARGGNGVIVITTKSGRPGRAKVNYNFFIGAKELTKKLDVMDPYDFIIYQSERSRGSNADSTSFVSRYGQWGDLSKYRNETPVDWQEEVMGKTGKALMHNINVSGGNKKLTYNLGYTYNDDKAVLINSSYRRNILNLKTDYKVTKKITVGVSSRYYYQNVYGAGVSDTKGSSYNRLRNAVKYRPFLSPGQDIDDNDPYADAAVGNSLGLVNPIALASAEYRRKSTEFGNIIASFSYNITKNISFKSTYGADYSKLVDRQFNDSITPYSVVQGGKKPIVRLDTVTRRTITNSNVFTWTVNDYKGKHDISVLLGQETYELKTTTRTSLFRDYPIFTTYQTAFTKTNLGVPFAGYPRLGKTRYTNLSFFSRINYSLLDKYLFSFNVRADGASKFAPGKQWGYFPAGSFAWRVKNEKFMENVNFINDLKFRVGYGQVGNNRINDYLFLTNFRNDGVYFYGLNNTPVYAYYSADLVNQDLKWESTISRNVGVDISMFNRRVDLSVDYYENSSKDLLLLAPIASTYGYSTQLQNVGETSNKGIEIQLNAGAVRKKDFEWNINFNISFNKNKVIALAKDQTTSFPGASWGVSGQPADYIQRIGLPVGSMWGLVTDGFYTTDDFTRDPVTGVYKLKAGVVNDSLIVGLIYPGTIKFKDLNGDGIVDLDRDRQVIGDPNPDFTGGLYQQFKYKNWDASIFLNFSYGNDVYNANKIELTNAYSNNSNMLAIMSGRWKIVTPSGQTTQWTVPNPVPGQPPLAAGLPLDQVADLNRDATIWQPIKTSGAFHPHSWAIEDGSFLRINNITLGYTFPMKAVNALKMEKIRFYFTTNNVALFTNYSGYDPEVSVRSNPLTPGLDYSAYPKSRSFIFGINATFR